MYCFHENYMDGWAWRFPFLLKICLTTLQNKLLNLLLWYKYTPSIYTYMWYCVMPPKCCTRISCMKNMNFQQLCYRSIIVPYINVLLISVKGSKYSNSDDTTYEITAEPGWSARSDLIRNWMENTREFQGFRLTWETEEISRKKQWKTMNEMLPEKCHGCIHGV